MEMKSWEENTAFLAKLQQKQKEIKEQVSQLAEQAVKRNWKKKISEKISTELNFFSQNLELSMESFYFSEKAKKELRGHCGTFACNSKNIMKKYGNDIETQILGRLIELYNLQASITVKTEELYAEKVNVLMGKIKRMRGKSAENEGFLKGLVKNDEVYKNMNRIVQENSEFLAAVKENLNQVTKILKPNISKTLLLLENVERIVPTRILQEFSQSKSEIELEYNATLEYIQSFIGLLDEFTDPEANFEKFSEISMNENSVHELTTEIDMKGFSREKERFLIEQSKVSDCKILIQAVKQELTSDANNIKNLRNVIEKLEKEKKIIEDSFNSSGDRCSCIKRISDSKIGLVVRAIRDVLNILGDAISIRKRNIKSLQMTSPSEYLSTDDYGNISDSAPSPASLKKHLSSSLKQNSKFTNLIGTRKSLEKMQHSDTFTKKSEQDFLENSVTDSIENFEIEQESLKFNLFCTENNHAIDLAKANIDLTTALNKAKVLEDKIKDLQLQNASYKERISELQEKNEKKLWNSAKLRNAQKTVKGLTDDYKILKKACFEGFSQISKEIQGNVKEMIGKFFAFQKDFEKENKGKIEELLECNEGLRIQTEALKDSFQMEVKKMNCEGQELKKMNKDLKDSLLKLSTKYDFQNKIIADIVLLIPNPIGENLACIKSFVHSQTLFFTEVSYYFQENNIEIILEKIKSLKPDKDCGSFAVTEPSLIVKELETYTGRNLFEILGFLKQKDSMLKSQILEIPQNFQKALRMTLAFFNNQIDENLEKLEKCLDFLRVFKQNPLKKNPNPSTEFNLLEEMTDHVCELEDQIQDHKCEQIGLNNIITKQAKDLIQAKEELNKAKLFTERSLHFFQELLDLDLKTPQFLELKSEVSAFLSSKS